MIDPNNPCIFCDTQGQKIVFDNDLVYATYDSYPVSKFHSLIIPKRHIDNYFNLSEDELLDINQLILKPYVLEHHLVFLQEMCLQRLEMF